MRIISQGGYLEDGYSLAEKSLQYFQHYPKISERVDQQIEAIVEKV